jgi:hypothetical protein
MELTKLTSSFRRAVITGAISLGLWSSVFLVEKFGRQPAVSGVAKALVASAVVMVLLGAVAVPVAGGLLSLFAGYQDLRHPDRRRQGVLAVLLGFVLIVLGLKWLSWVMDPRGNPPGMDVG